MADVFLGLLVLCQALTFLRLHVLSQRADIADERITLLRKEIR